MYLKEICFIWIHHSKHKYRIIWLLTSNFPKQSHFTRSIFYMQSKFVRWKGKSSCRIQSWIMRIYPFVWGYIFQTPRKEIRRLIRVVNKICKRVWIKEHSIVKIYEHICQSCMNFTALGMTQTLCWTVLNNLKLLSPEFRIFLC